jgi:hypothetical protein
LFVFLPVALFFISFGIAAIYMINPSIVFFDKPFVWPGYFMIIGGLTFLACTPLMVAYGVFYDSQTLPVRLCLRFGQPLGPANTLGAAMLFGTFIFMVGLAGFILWEMLGSLGLLSAHLK